MMNKQLGQLIRPQTLARFAPVANIALIILLASTLADLTIQWLPQPPILTDANLSVATPTKTALASNTSNPDAQQIASWHLFGKVQQAQSKPVIKAPETKLDLRLAGILYTSDKPLALIAADKGAETSYTVGDSLSNEVKVHEILTDRVILSRKGKLETLSLPQPSDSSANTASTSPLRSPTPATTTNRRSTSATIKAASVVAPLRNELQTNPAALQNLAFATPHFEAGQFQGFHLQPGHNRRLLGQLGLRTGDILTGVNGVDFNDPNQALVLLQELQSADQIQARILRNGQAMALTFLLNE